MNFGGADLTFTWILYGYTCSAFSLCHCFIVTIPCTYSDVILMFFVDASRDEDDDDENAREAELVAFDGTTQGLGNVYASASICQP